MDYNAIYRKTPTMKDFDLIVVDKNMSIPFPKNAMDILISSSGGADSTLLTFLLASHIAKNSLSTTIHMIQFERMWKTRPWQIDIASQVYEKISKMFPTVKFKRHTHVVPIVVESKKIDNADYGESLIMDELLEKTCHMFNISVIYNATTANPPNVSFKGPESRNVLFNDTEEDIGRLLHTWNTNLTFCNPFLYINKKWIIAKYSENAIIELLNVTRSCEGENSNKTYKTWDRNLEALEDCNYCFWCMERNWALAQNNLLDRKNKYGKVI